MAWRRLAASDAAPHLLRGVSTSTARTFSAAAAAASCFPPPAANPTTLLGRRGVQGIWSRYSRSNASASLAFQAGVPRFGAFPTAARMPPGVRTKFAGLMKGFGTGGAALAVMLYPIKVADAKEGRPAERPSEDNSVPSENSKQALSELWNFVRKYQLTVGLILLIAYGWRKPIVLVINILLLLYSSRPDPYSIYLFLQENHQRKVCKNPALWKEEFVQTRKVDTEDYKLFSIGTVELKDKTVLHVIGILGSWWIYHVSHVKREEQWSGLWNLFAVVCRDMGGRNIGVAVDFSSCSKAALRWASTNLTRNGDQLILIHVNNSSNNEQGAMHLWEQSGSPLIPLVEFSDPHVTKTYGLSPDKETLEILAEVANQRGVEVFAKIFYGDPTKKLCESVDLVPLSCLVIGSRGLSTLKRALMGSVSAYVVNHATCPVTVVKGN